jgi:DNA repair photolyase
VTEQVTRKAIQILHRHGHKVHILTKGGSRALRDRDLLTPGDAFGSTLTFLDAATSATWEPGAASPEDRIATLKVFHDAGIPTWASLEPVIDPDTALEIIRRTHAFVNLFKVGRWNYDKRANEIDWRKFAQDAVRLLESLGAKYLLKQDLKKFLGEAN